MQSIEWLAEQWDTLLREMPGLKVKLMDRVGRTMEPVVKSKVGGSGKVQGWQSSYVGSKGGYAAVRPKADTYVTTPGGKRYAVGYLTNAIENGHAIRRASPVKKAGYRYRPRIKTAQVPGLHFYRGSEARAKQNAEAAVEEFAQELARRLGGGT